MSRIERALEEALNKRKQASGDGQHSASPRASSRLERTSDRPTRRPTFPVDNSNPDLSNVSVFARAVIDGSGIYAESYRKICLSLASQASRHAGTTVLVTSASSGEGKSITSLNTALVMAQGIDHTVLIVDADLRKPSLHEHLGVHVQKGLSDYLSDESLDLSEVLIRTGFGKLVLLPAGQPSENPSELLTSNRMKDLIADLKHRYPDRFIILDAGPVLAVAEPATLAKWVDGVLYVVQEGGISKKVAYEGIELLKEAHIFGIVMNSVNNQLLSHLGGYDYPYVYGRKRDLNNGP